MADFDWPWQYKFPPFFTVQPNIETRAKQLEAWCNLVLAYQKHMNQSTLHVKEAINSELFTNKQLSRKLSLADAKLVLEELRKKGNLEWIDRDQSSCLLFWRSPVEWGKLIYNWISSRSMTNTVCTFYELTEGEDSEGEPFHGLEKAILLKALNSLESQGKAELIHVEGSEGVKFF